MGIENLAARLTAGHIIILDGGMGTEISRRGVASGSSELSVSGMLDSPDRIQEIHEDFIEAGADLITTNTYIGNSGNLGRWGQGPEQVARVNTLAVDIARKARDSASKGREVVIAGSLGPFGLSYTPDDVPSYEVSLKAYRQQVAVLAEAGVDLIMVETCTRVSEARAGVVAAVESGLPAWAGFVADAEGRILGGETLAEAEELLRDAGASAVLINCTAAPFVAPALRGLSKHRQLPMGAYAQGAIYEGSGWDFQSSMSPKEYLAFAREWVSLGAQLIGGCCGTTPDHIRELRANLPERIAA